MTDGMLHQNLKHPDSIEWNHVAIAVMNSGGIRASIQQGWCCRVHLDLQTGGRTYGLIKIQIYGWAQAKPL